MKISRSEKTLALTLVGAAVILVGMVAGFNPLARMRDRQLQPYCARSMAALSQSLQLYSQDYDGRFPASSLSPTVTPGKSQPYGWAQACAFTYANYTMLRCPKATSAVSGNPASRGFVSYWLNGNLAGQKRSLAIFPTKTLLVGDGDDGVDLSNATYTRTNFPTNWLTDWSKPPFRHSGGANYLFVDGHIRWLRPEEIQHFGGRPDPFAPR